MKLSLQVDENLECPFSITWITVFSFKTYLDLHKVKLKGRERYLLYSSYSTHVNLTLKKNHTWEEMVCLSVLLLSYSNGWMDGWIGK